MPRGLQAPGCPPPPATAAGRVNKGPRGGQRFVEAGEAGGLARPLPQDTPPGRLTPWPPRLPAPQVLPLRVAARGLQPGRAPSPLRGTAGAPCKRGGAREGAARRHGNGGGAALGTAKGDRGTLGRWAETLGN